MLRWIRRLLRSSSDDHGASGLTKQQAISILEKTHTSTVAGVPFTLEWELVEATDEVFVFECLNAMPGHYYATVNRRSGAVTHSGMPR